MNQLLWGWLWVRHKTGSGNSFDGDSVVFMLTPMGPDANPYDLPERKTPCQVTALDSASGVFVNVYVGCGWFLASVTGACENREGICFTALGWQVNFI